MKARMNPPLALMSVKEFIIFTLQAYMGKVRGTGSGHLRSEVKTDTSFWDGMKGTQPLGTWWVLLVKVDLRPSRAAPAVMQPQSNALSAPH